MNSYIVFLIGFLFGLFTSAVAIGLCSASGRESIEEELTECKEQLKRSQ